ncbi:NAD(P)-dependent oxidoreductase [Leucobacter luti]|uniref:Phosphoglycerate dehydrogenase-like enzyme n=1 Tax=Leucobacter luti TaxID=340320 RepID=A0A4Q7U655_9MICO|nr:NAD(P)-dependent oxidoreductase [Leucobacter luti]MBL3700709.1 hydroxyacid dehydrogenase [Leucobacter luti]RZT68450.1 phosphoglycerate dehydrogenase-like enzyme [Leucobacter luti]
MSDTALRIRVIGDLFPELAEQLAATGAEAVQDAADAQGIVCSYGGTPAELHDTLAAHPGIPWVQLPSAGIEAFAASLRDHPGLIWTSAKGAFALPVAEHALALTLALLRELPERVRARSWAPASGTSLHGLHVVVVGAGGVGLEIVRLMKCFDTRVTVVRRRGEPVAAADRTVTDAELMAVLPTADVVVLAAAATPDTRQLIDAAALAALPAHAVLINIARGALVDTDALVAALGAGRIAGAALDVTDPEPLPDGHPLWEEPRALITPHAADTLEMIRPLYAARVGENVARRRAGRELVGLVDPAAGY